MWSRVQMSTCSNNCNSHKHIGRQGLLAMDQQKEVISNDSFKICIYNLLFLDCWDWPCFPCLFLEWSECTASGSQGGPCRSGPGVAGQRCPSGFIHKGRLSKLRAEWAVVPKKKERFSVGKSTQSFLLHFFKHCQNCYGSFNQPKNINPETFQSRDLIATCNSKKWYNKQQ